MGVQKIFKSCIHRISVGVISLTLTISLAFPMAANAVESPTTSQSQETSNTSQNPTNAAASVSSTEATPDNTTDSSTQNMQSPAPTVTVTENPNSSTAVSTNNPNSTTINTSKTEASINNTVDSSVSSGDATASKNTTVGDITSGDVEALVTIVNMLQSSVNLHGNQPILFTHNVTGAVHGDLVIDPAVLASLGTTSGVYGDGSSANLSTHATINNSVNVNATSGNASALQNTTAGNVQTGSANSIVNVINLINSAINANQSFIGMINIHGNLNGNILVPQEFVDSVLQANTTDVGSNTDTITTTDNNATVTNTITTNAQSGSATATDNSTSGATNTGDANTKVTLLNLTSSHTTSKNALLVFVNVMGTWVGLILDAPPGSTSAALGSSGNNTARNTTNQTANSENNLHINNSINASSTSGNANGSQNTTVGNVQSGDANVGVNLVNILNSQISLSDWFGVLFINVFGTWHGNFGVQNAVNPNNPITPSTGNDGNSGLNFVPTGSQNYQTQSLTQYLTTYRTTTVQTTSTTMPTKEIIQIPTQTLGSSVERTDSKPRTVAHKNNIESQGFKIWWLPFVLLLLAALIGRYITTHRRKQHGEI
jgi:hypothetical protein